MAAARQAEMRPIHPASLGARLGAYVLDWLVGFIVTCALLAAAGLVLLLASDMGRQDPPDRALYAALGVAGLTLPLWLALTLVGWTWRGQSIGMTAIGLRVVDWYGDPPSLPRALLRLIIYTLENAPLAAIGPIAGAALALRAQANLTQALAGLGVALLAPLVSLAIALVDRYGRAPHDLIAGTLVIAE
ncbi:MAG: RDD family protein [Dehalococcoidia bacterium]